MARPRLKNCRCRKCGNHWQDLPGCRAKHSRNGCPGCGHLYWTETDA